MQEVVQYALEKHKNVTICINQWACSQSFEGLACGLTSIMKHCNCVHASHKVPPNVIKSTWQPEASRARGIHEGSIRQRRPTYQWWQNTYSVHISSSQLPATFNSFFFFRWQVYTLLYLMRHIDIHKGLASQNSHSKFAFQYTHSLSQYNELQFIQHY